MESVDRQRLKSLMQREQQRFVNERPKSKALFERAGKSLLGGVPMNWMVKWAGAFPPFVREAQGAQFYDVDGLRYIDFCLGDTGAMTGHSPFATVKAVEEQIKRGITLMLPSEDAIFVAEELQQRFGLPFWQFALTATDANRFAIRLARQITQRPKILVFNWCYHGTVDESFITLTGGIAQSRRGNIGPPIDPTVTTKVVEFNDASALEEALAPGDVACVLAEPVMTNVGIVHPDPGYHKTLRELTDKFGTLLIIDETHTICAGPGGYTRAENLDPDIFIFGKAIAGGVPGAAYGFTEAVASTVAKNQSLEDCDTGGIGGTLAGNALSLAAMRATLSKVLTKDAFARMIPGGGTLGCRSGEGDHRIRSSLARHAIGMPCRISVFSHATAKWRRGSSGHGFRTRAVHASLRNEPRYIAHSFSQYGTDVAAGRSGGRRSAHSCVPRSAERIGGIASSDTLLVPR